jgi:hypothetical protein
MSRQDELPRDRPLVLVCHLGGRSLQAAQYLDSAGFAQCALTCAAACRMGGRGRADNADVLIIDRTTPDAVWHAKSTRAPQPIFPDRRR